MCRPYFYSHRHYTILATYAGINLTEQRRRDKAELHASHIGSRNETRNIGNYTATDTQNKCRAVGSQLYQTAVDGIDCEQSLARLAQTDEDMVKRLKHRVIVAVDIGI